MTASYLVFDIETAPTSETAHLWQPQPDDKKQFAPLDAHKIISLAWAKVIPAKDVFSYGVLTEPDLNELLILKQFEKLLYSFDTKQSDNVVCTLVTFNGRVFDVPVILHRAYRYGLSAEWYFNTKEIQYRYSAEGHLDLSDYMSGYGAMRDWLSFQKYCMLIGLPGKVDAKGHEVAQMYAEGKFSEIAEYNLLDTLQQVFVLYRLQLLRGFYGLDFYRKIAAFALAKIEQDANSKISQLATLTNRSMLLLS